MTEQLQQTASIVSVQNTSGFDNDGFDTTQTSIRFKTTAGEYGNFSMTGMNLYFKKGEHIDINIKTIKN